MNKLEDVQNWRGKNVVDADGDKIGTIEDVFLDRHTGEPEWATVKTGLFGLKSSFVPIRDAPGDRRRRGAGAVPEGTGQGRAEIDADGRLSPDQERQLWEYYGRSDYDELQGEDRTTALDMPDDRGDAERPAETDGGDDGAPAIVVVRCDA